MQNTFTRVAKIRALLGSHAVLIPVPYGTKKPADKGWTSTTAEQLNDPPFLARLESGNIGVLLGTKGDNIVTIDADSGAFRDALLRSNPWLADTLTTTGARGCNFWLRLKGNFPTRTRKLKDASGNDLGEWRADGSQTVISGSHPEGMDYRILVEKPPLEVEFNQIVWPSICVTLLTSSESISSEGQRDRETETEPTSQRANESVAPSIIVSFAVNVLPSLPTAPRQNHNRLFLLARAVKTAEKRINRSATREELRHVFGEWYDGNQFLRAEQTRADYWLEFMDAYNRVHTGTGENPVPELWARANAEPVPPEIVERLRDEENDLLCRVAFLCYLLQAHVGDAPFILSCRDLGKLMQRDFRLANLYLLLLRKLAVIEVAAKGSGLVASRYRYVLKGGGS